MKLGIEVVSAYVTDSALIARLHVGLASVTRVNETVLALLRVQLEEHGQGGELGAAQGGEFIVFVPGQG